MKRFAIVAAAILLVFGAIAVSATHDTKEKPAVNLANLGAVDGHKYPTWLTNAQASVPRFQLGNIGASGGGWIPCAINVSGFGLDVVGIASPNPVLAWVSAAHWSAGLTYEAANQACAAESFYLHVGHRKLCWNAHFRFWADDGEAVFDNGLNDCLHTPATLDAVLCKFLPHDDVQQECYDALLRDYLLAVVQQTWGGIGYWLF